MATEFFQCNYILSLALFFTTTLIRDYIIQHQDMKNPLRQSYRNIAFGSEEFICLSILLHFLLLRLTSFLRRVPITRFHEYKFHGNGKKRNENGPLKQGFRIRYKRKLAWEEKIDNLN